MLNSFLNIAFLLIKFNKKLAKNVNTSEYVTKVAFHNESFIFILEAWWFSPHLVKELSF